VRLLCVALMGTVLFAADDVPDWVRQAAAQSIPAFPAKVFLAGLLQEESLTVESDGRRTMRERGVIKVLQKSNEALIASRTYNTRAGRIRDFRAWLLSPNGSPISLGKDKVVDVALSPEYTYDEGRAKVISAGSGLAPGSVFAYEVTEEEKSVFTHYVYAFQNSRPVLVSRFMLSTPASWEVQGVVFNHDPVQPVVSGGVYTWEMRDLPWIEHEPYSPSLHALAPWLGVTYFPPDDKAGLTRLNDWQAVSAWVASLVDPAAEESPAIRAKSAELTRDMTSETDKIRAIGAFVQQVNYVSVQTNITRGGGYTPHRADEVLSRNYGDCKDKATLMRALLKGAGIGSYLTMIDASDRQYVRPEWVSVQQFDHAIVAVRVSPETNLPTVFQHPRLGRLLMFDPTDTDTPFGDLPVGEQGGHALIVAGAQGGLADLPLLPAGNNRIESSAEASMDFAGRLEAHVGRQYFGQAAAQAHARMAHQENADLRRSYELSLGRRLGAIIVKQAEMSGLIGDGHMRLSLDFTAAQFSQTTSLLMIVKPGALALGVDYIFPPGERKLPVKLEADLYKDAVRIKLPAGFKIDELPEAVHLESRYGAYRANWKADGEDLVFEQSTEVRDVLVPAAQYAEIRAFFDRIGGSQMAPVVLVRK